MNLGIRSPMRKSPPVVIGDPFEDSSSASETPATNGGDIFPFNTIPAGTKCVLVVMQPSQGKLVTACVDSVGGNTWAVDASFAALGVGLSFVSCTLATQIDQFTTISLTFSPTTLGSSWVYWLLTIENLGVFDKTANGNGNAATSGSTGSTAALASANEMVFGVTGLNGSSGNFTKGASYSIANLNQNSNRTLLQWKKVAATTAVASDCTWITARNWAALLATYKAVP